MCSQISRIPTLVRKNLSEGKPVLYTGTPCQIAGLYAYLGGDKEKLYTLDLSAMEYRLLNFLKNI